MTVGDTQARSESTPVSFYGLALRLRRGVSDIVTWSADRGSIPGTMTIGADPTCDWSIRGPGIAPVELWMSAPGGRLRVKSARPGFGARLDGQPLGEGWVELDPGSRLEFGFACLALEFDAAPLGGGEAVREPAVAFLGTPIAERSGATHEEEEEEEMPTPVSTRLPSSPPPPRATARVADGPRASERLPSQARPSDRPPPSAPRTVSRASTAKDVAKVLGGHKPSSRKTSVVLYTLIGLLTLCAYGGWLFLLERF